MEKTGLDDRSTGDGHSQRSRESQSAEGDRQNGSSDDESESGRRIPEHSEENEAALLSDDGDKSAELCEDPLCQDPNPFVSTATIDNTPKPPDGGWGWMVVVGCMLGHVLIVGSARAFGIFYVALMEKFESSATATALVPSLFNCLRMLLGSYHGYKST